MEAVLAAAGAWAGLVLGRPVGPEAPCRDPPSGAVRRGSAAAQPSSLHTQKPIGKAMAKTCSRGPGARGPGSGGTGRGAAEWAIIGRLANPVNARSRLSQLAPKLQALIAAIGWSGSAGVYGSVLTARTRNQSDVDAACGFPRQVPSFEQ